MDLETKILEVIEPYLRDHQDPWTMSPCLIKMALFEITHVYSNANDQPMVDSLVAFITNPTTDLIPSGLPSHLRGLCIRYTQRVPCGVSFAEAFERSINETLIRGGLQSYSDPIVSGWFAYGMDHYSRPARTT